MSETKVSTFMIGIIIIGLVMGVIGIAMAELSQNYEVDYDNQSIETYNQLNEINVLTEEIKSTAEGFEGGGGFISEIYDATYLFLVNSYNTLLITAKSFGIFTGLIEQGVDDANLGASGKLFKIAFNSITIILIFVGVIVSAMVKKNL